MTKQNLDYKVNTDYKESEVYKALDEKSKVKWDGLIDAYCSVMDRCMHSIYQEEIEECRKSMGQIEFKFDKLFHKKIIWYIKV